MARVKRGVTTHARHKKILGLAKGYRGRRCIIGIMPNESGNMWAMVIAVRDAVIR